MRIARKTVAMPMRGPGVLVLAQDSLSPLLFNEEAVRALVSPDTASGSVDSPQELSRLIDEKLALPSGPHGHRFVRTFRSGQRTYSCHTMTLELPAPGAKTTLLLLERDISPARLLLRNAAEAFGLSPREKEVVELLVRGKTTKEIAVALRISPNTVKAFVRGAMSKMDVTTRSGIVGRVLLTH